ncbi:MAG: insulinase family protein [Clostridia bacterium]|nr:insulinase family protein [Clostridia bacterium]
MTEWTLHSCSKLEERYYETRHPSGLRILVAPKDLSAAYATVGVSYGSRDRFAGGALPMGTAHFLEHKMFERPDGDGGGTSWEDIFSALGAEVNAYTSDDCTAYMFSATEHIPDALEALLAMVTDLSVTSDSVSRERQIIAEEIRMNADDPWEVCYANMLRGLYAPVKEGGNPVREEICGTEASIRRITPAVLREAHRRFYHPENMVLAVSGRVTPEEVLAVADKVLGNWPLCPALFQALPSGRRPHDPLGVYKPRMSVRMDTAKPLFSIGVKLQKVPEEPVALTHLERLMTVLCEMLFSRSGDFYDRLFEAGTVSPGMSYGSSVGRPALGDTAEGYGYFYLSGESDDPELVYGEFTDYIRTLRENGLDRDAFDRARRTLYADYIYGFDSTEGIASSLMTAAMDGVELYDLLEMDGGITFTDVSDLFMRTFIPTQYTLSTVYPSEQSL